VPELAFRVLGAEPASDAASPSVALQLEISNRPADQLIHSVMLRCQVQIETPRRRYSNDEKTRLHDLFGEPERWGQTLRAMLWTNVAVAVPEFTGAAQVELTLPCTFDLDTGATKYFCALEDGTAPLALLFSGAAFYHASSAQIQMAPISWNSEARFAFPVEVWKRSFEGNAPGALKVGA
jgi:hypothetical protein